MEEKNMSPEELAELRLQSGKMKKKLILILGGICLAVVALFAVIVLISPKDEEGNLPENPIRTYEDADFYEPYQGDIMKNKEYLALDRKVYYSDGSGMETSIEEDNLNEFDNNVIFLYKYLQTIVAGDCGSYNACFNQAYYQNNSPMGSFNPQMLYGSKITFYSRGNDDQGVWVTYKLEYMIHRNDGSFRRDILSDASLPQYITLRNDSEYGISIEKIVTHYEVVVSPNS